MRSKKRGAQELSNEEEDDAGDVSVHPDRKRLRRPKAKTFKKELNEAERRRLEREVAREAKEKALAERAKKIAERDRWRKAMTKARRPGPDGQRKLGRESKLLLERVQKIVQ